MKKYIANKLRGLANILSPERRIPYEVKIDKYEGRRYSERVLISTSTLHDLYYEIVSQHCGMPTNETIERLSIERAKNTIITNITISRVININIIQFDIDKMRYSDEIVVTGSIVLNYKTN